MATIVSLTSAGIATALSSKAPIESPVFIGNPQAVTQSLDDATENLATTAFVSESLAAFSIDPDYVFRPESYGAVGNGTTDDTVAIQDAINAAFAYATTSTSHYCEIQFKATIYRVDGTLKSGAVNGYAYSMLYLPNVAATAHKITVKFKGAGGSTSLPHSSQTSNQVGGTSLKTIATGLSYSGTLGSPSILGGPCIEQNGYAINNPVFNNIHVIIDGITLLAPVNPTMDGFNFSLVDELTVIEAGVISQQVPGSATIPSNIAAGLKMPISGNGGVCDVIRYSAEGWYRGIIVGENATIFSVRALHCSGAIGIISSMGHGSTIQHAFAKSCNYAVEVVTTVAANSGLPQLNIQLLELDSLALGWFHDVSNFLAGRIDINFSGEDDTTPSGVLPTGIHLTSSHSSSGNQGSPALPASTIAHQNTGYQTAAVTIVGGTVTAITVDGLVLGITSGTVIVPSFKSIAITYSSAPTWKWISL